MANGNNIFFARRSRKLQFAKQHNDVCMDMYIICVNNNKNIRNHVIIKAWRELGSNSWLHSFIVLYRRCGEKYKRIGNDNAEASHTCFNCTLFIVFPMLGDIVCQRIIGIRCR